MNDKINEFINNDNLKEIFDKLKLDLLHETGHLSSLQEIENSESYKKILSYGKNILPYLIEEIRKDGYCSFTLCRICFILIKPNYIEIKNENSVVTNIKKRLIEWWDENKWRYAE